MYLLFKNVFLTACSTHWPLLRTSWTDSFHLSYQWLVRNKQGVIDWQNLLGTGVLVGFQILLVFMISRDLLQFQLLYDPKIFFPQKEQFWKAFFNSFQFFSSRFGWTECWRMQTLLETKYAFSINFLPISISYWHAALPAHLSGSLDS